MIFAALLSALCTPGYAMKFRILPKRYGKRRREKSQEGKFDEIYFGAEI